MRKIVREYEFTPEEERAVARLAGELGKIGRAHV